MNFEMLDVGPPLTNQRVDALERYLGIVLPETYKSFLTRYNGGRPRPNFFTIHGFEGNPFGSVHYFFGLDRPIRSNNIDWNYQIYDRRIPRELLPIAGDGSGNIICLSLEGVNKDFVYYWDHDTETSPPTYENIYLISDTFDKFINDIHDEDISAEVAEASRQRP